MLVLFVFVFVLSFENDCATKDGASCNRSLMTKIVNLRFLYLERPTVRS